MTNVSIHHCHYALSSITYSLIIFFFFFNDTATTEIYPLSLHDALPISSRVFVVVAIKSSQPSRYPWSLSQHGQENSRSEEHTSELQSQSNLVCRLLLEKKKKNKHRISLTAVNLYRPPLPTQ